MNEIDLRFSIDLFSFDYLHCAPVAVKLTRDKIANWSSGFQEGRGEFGDCFYPKRPLEVAFEKTPKMSFYLFRSPKN